MHELAVTENILDIATRHAVQANASRVTDINITIGRLSSIVDDSVQFYWDIVSKDTICQGATLHFLRIPARLQCLDCGHEYILESELTPCPSCGGVRVNTLSGNEFWLESLEIERESDKPS